MPLRVISRPLTDSRLPTCTNRCSRPKKSARWKKFPWKVKVNGSTGKPAGPTVAPGGSVALDACEAWAEVEPPGLEPLEVEPLELEPAAGGVGGAAEPVVPPDPALNVRL